MYYTYVNRSNKRKGMHTGMEIRLIGGDVNEDDRLLLNPEILDGPSYGVLAVLVFIHRHHHHGGAQASIPRNRVEVSHASGSVGQRRHRDWWLLLFATVDATPHPKIACMQLKQRFGVEG